MYLTRAFLDPFSRAVRADVRNPESLHKTVMRAFPDNAGPLPRRAHSILYRLDEERDGRCVLLVQSRTKPMTERWPAGYVLTLDGNLDFGLLSVGENPAVRSVDADWKAFRAGRRLLFRLRANTTKKIDTKTGPDGARRNGQRVPVRGDEARLKWLTRHANAAGFSFDEKAVRISEIRPTGGGRQDSVTVAGAVFEGILVIRDADRFREAVEAGIGPAKAYGFGLLSVRAVR